MQRKTRRPPGIGSRKISVSITEADLRVVTAQAKRLHRGNVSAVLHDMVETLRRQHALDELIESFGAAPASEAELDALRTEIAASAPARRERRRRPAA